jgi:hypothetical protein
MVLCTLVSTMHLMQWTKVQFGANTNKSPDAGRHKPCTLRTASRMRRRRRSSTDRRADCEDLLIRQTKLTVSGAVPEAGTPIKFALGADGFSAVAPIDAAVGMSRSSQVIASRTMRFAIILRLPGPFWGRSVSSSARLEPSRCRARRGARRRRCTTALSLE